MTNPKRFFFRFDRVALRVDRLTLNRFGLNRLGLCWLGLCWLGLCWLGLCWLGGATVSLAQTGNVVLRQGGIIQGTLLNQEANTDYELQLPGGGTLVLPVESVQRVSAPSPEILWYRQNAPLMDDSIEIHQQMAKLCKEKNLPQLAQKHYERILELDPENEEIHRLLRHEKINGVWMSRKEHEEQNGYEYFAGRYMSQQEKMIEQQEQNTQEEQRYWKRSLNELHKELKNDRFPSIENIAMIHSPGALLPASELYRKEPDPRIRKVFVQIMGNIASPAAMGALATIALKDDDEEIRLTALDFIKRKMTALPGAAEFFRGALRNSSDNAEINRAAFALGVFQVKNAIPDLINALVTEHSQTVVVGNPQTSASFDSSGRMNSFSPGGSPRSKMVTEKYQNETVLNALLQIVSLYYLSPVDFQYDVEAWKDWYFQQQQIYRFNARRN